MFDKPEQLRDIASQANREMAKRREENEFGKRVQQIKDRIHMAACCGRNHVDIPKRWVSSRISDILIDGGYHIQARERCDREMGENWVSTYLRISW